TASYLALRRPAAPPALPSFPTRRSSDLPGRRRSCASDAGSRRDGQPRARIDLRQRQHLGPVDQRLPEFLSGLCRALHDERRQSRSEEHTSELQSRENLVCRLLLEKKKTQ